jgi:hypothetical protein
MTEMLPELVISEVKSGCIPWDMKHKSYHSQLLVDREWSKIAKNATETGTVRPHLMLFNYYVDIIFIPRLHTASC